MIWAAFFVIVGVLVGAPLWTYLAIKENDRRWLARLKIAERYR